MSSPAPAGLRLLKEGPFGALAPPKALDFDGTSTTVQNRLQFHACWRNIAGLV